MKKLLFYSLFLSIYFIGKGQATDSLSVETDTLKIDTTEKKIRKHLIGVYIEGGVSIEPVGSTMDQLVLSQFGVRFNKWEIGYRNATFDEFLIRRIIFPNQFQFKYAHNGVFLIYSLYSNRKLDLGVYSNVQFGDMVWERFDNKEDLFRTKFKIYRAGVRIESPFLRFLRPTVVLGYQTMSEIEIPDLNSDDFTGFFMGFTVKVGYFNQ